MADFVLSEKQEDFLARSVAPFNFCCGAVSAGKTWITNIRFWESMAEPAEGGLNYIIGKTRESAVENVVRPLQQLFGERTIPLSMGSLWTARMHGHEVRVIGANDERAETKIRGRTIGRCLGDELTLWPESFWNMLATRLRVPGAMFWGTTNPDSPNHYFKKKVLDNKDFEYLLWTFRMEDNAWLVQNNPAYIERVKKQFGGGVFFRRFVLGEWSLADGLVYGSVFDEKRHRVDMARVMLSRKLKPFKHHIVGIDYAASDKDALTFGLWGFDDHELARGPAYLLRESYYVADPANGRPKLTNAQMAYRLVSFLAGIRPAAIYVDPSARSFITELKEMGLPVKGAQNDVLDGIAFCENLIGQDKLFFAQDAKHTYDEFCSYAWDSAAQAKGVTKPKKDSDHCMDGVLRYPIFTHFGHSRRIIYAGAR